MDQDTMKLVFGIFDLLIHVIALIGMVYILNKAKKDGLQEWD